MPAPAMAPKEASDRTDQVTFKVVPEWIERADKIARALSQPPAIVTVTRTEVLRAALGRGLDVLEEETPAPKPRKR
jgi:hypothetical protein